MGCRRSDACADVNAIRAVGTDIAGVGSKDDLLTAERLATELGDVRCSVRRDIYLGRRRHVLIQRDAAAVSVVATKGAGAAGSALDLDDVTSDRAIDSYTGSVSAVAREGILTGAAIAA